jgi:hypothetical protein
MDVRQSLRDAGLAVLLALPTATLAGPSSAMWHSSTTAAPVRQQQIATPERTAPPSRFALPR